MFKLRARVVSDHGSQLNFEQLEQYFAKGFQLATYTVATRPTNLPAGTIVYVSDGGAGAVFQGWNGAAWVNLG